MCPILDLANHRPSGTHILPVQPAGEDFWSLPRVPSSAPQRGVTKLGGDYSFLSSSKTPITEGDELFLQYGAHANRTLFVEYGFVNRFDQGSIITGEFGGEAEVDDLVKERIKMKGPLGNWIQQELEAEGSDHPATGLCTHPHHPRTHHIA